MSITHNAVCTLRVVEPVRILVGDVLTGLRSLPSGSVHCCVTSPPYWGLRDYGVDGQIGLEGTPDAYVAKMVEVFREVRRTLRDDGTLFLNLGDSYAASGMGGNPDESEHRKQATNIGSLISGRKAPLGLKPKDLCMIPWRVALALQADGWWLRSVIVWAKKSPMPESVTDRPTSSWEPIFLLAKSDRYFYDAEAVKEQGSTGAWDAMPPIGGIKHAGSNGNATYSGDRPASSGTRNQRNVWHLGPEPFNGYGESVQWLPVEVGAVGGDIRRTPSADCPVHGCQDSRPDGEHVGDQSARSPGTCGGLAPSPDPSLRTSSPTAGEADRGCSSGSPDEPCSPTAIARSTQSRRTAPALGTTPPCTPSAQTGGHTPGTSASPDCSDSAGRSRESSSGAGSASHEPGTSGGQSSRRTEGTCTCQYHRRVTKKVDHFATFPTEIPRRAIKAGTSEKGCCQACGAPWSRVVARTQIKRDRPNDYTKRTGEDGTGNSCANSVAGVESRTVGWEATCGCKAGQPVPCVVLDPFLGSGTTVAVARTLGRHGVGCELNPEYADLARVRIGKAERPHTFADQSKIIDGDTLFAASQGAKA